MRKLVTIREIKALYPIPKADRIEQAIIDGWSVIVKKDEFKVGDLCVFYEIDSFCPKEPRYEFLGKTKVYKETEGYRIKTMKIRKTLSQGLALPLSMFPELEGPSLNDDVTQMLNITKYDVSEVQPNDRNVESKRKLRNFPTFLPKTDQERIQNLTYYFTTLQNEGFEETLKLDGSSMTIYKKSIKLPWYKSLLNYLGLNIKTYEFGVCSRNIDLKEDISNFWKMARKLDLESKLPVDYAIQGELCGPKIQANHEKLHDYEFFLFDIFDIKRQKYLTPSERAHMMSESLQTVKHVPVISPTIKIFKDHNSLDSLLKHVEGDSLNSGIISEGRVYKSIANPSITFKVISNKYLLKCEK